MKYIIINIILFIITCIIIYCKKDNSKINNIDKNYKKILFIFFILIIITSIYKLGIVPNGIHVDEAGMFYDASLLAKFGYDRYLNKLPVYLINYGGGQSAMYAYLTAILIKIFQNKLILMRIPSILFRIISFISAYYLIENEKNKLKRIIFLFLLTITPYFIMQSRWGLDCNLLVSFMTISISLFINSIIKNNNKLLFLSGIFFGLTLYTYALSYVILPIFIIIILGYLLYIKKVTIKKIIIFIAPLIFLSIPLILMILVNNNIIKEIKWIITIPKLPSYRGNEISFSNILLNFRIFIVIVSFDKILGGENLLYNSIPYFGTLYYISIPFVIIGLSTCIKKTISDIKTKTLTIDIIMLTWFISVIICMLLIKWPNINKANAIFIPLIYFTSLGIINIVTNSKTKLKYILIIYSINYLVFLQYYYFEYNKQYYTQPYFATYYLEALDYSKGLKQNNIYIDPRIINESYIYIYLKENINPNKYNTSIINYENKNYLFTIPKNLDDNTIYITKHLPNNYNYKKIGDVYIVYK